MKTLLLLVGLVVSCHLLAQKTVPATDSFIIEGYVKNSMTVKQTDLDSFATYSMDSLPLYNNQMQPRRTVRGIKGVLLRDVLTKAIIDGGATQFSEVYITCTGSDGYKVVFSWNELFNTPVGDKVLLLTESDGQKGLAMPYRITLLSSADKATGRRYVKGLQKVMVIKAQ